MKDRFTIGQLASEIGVQTSTLRYYERAKLLRPDGRTDGNYRYYSPEAVERVRFIRVAQAAGFSLEDISALLDVRDGESAPCDEVEALIGHRLAEVRSRLKDLREVERHLKKFQAVCRESAQKDSCGVLDELSTKSALAP